jgi:hypothetical protein
MRVSLALVALMALLQRLPLPILHAVRVHA